MLEHGFRKYEIIKLLNDIKKTIKRVEENVPTQIDNAINQLLDGAPEALDTLKELADALGNNPDIITELNNKIDSINTKKDWNQNDEDADDYIENRTHYLEEGKYIFYKPNATSFNSSDRISLDDALDILNGIDNTYLTRSVIVRNISTSYNTHHKEKCQLIVTDGYLYLNTQYNNSNNDYTDFYNLNDFANRIKSIDEEVTYDDIKTLLNNNSMTFNADTNYFEKSDDIYHKLDKNYLPDDVSINKYSNNIEDYVYNINDDPFILDPGEKEYAYGILVDFRDGKKTDSDGVCTRIGNMDFHRTLPCHTHKGQIYSLLTKEVLTELNPENWNLAYNGHTAEEIASMMANKNNTIEIHTDRFYCTSKVLHRNLNGNPDLFKVMFSPVKINDRYFEVKEQANDFRQGRLCTINGRKEFVANLAEASSDVIGGNQGYTNNDINYKSNNNGKVPITGISRVNMRNFVGNDNRFMMNYYTYLYIIYWAFVIEYNTLDSIKAVNNNLDENGYRQGGLGIGITSTNESITSWTNSDYYFSSNNTSKSRPSIRNIGVTNSLGNRTGEIIVQENGKTYHQNRYRGFEFPFGDLGKIIDGFAGFTVNEYVNNDENGNNVKKQYIHYYLSNDPSKYSDTPSDAKSNMELIAKVISYSDNYMHDDGQFKLAVIGDKGLLIPCESQDYVEGEYFKTYQYGAGDFTDEDEYVGVPYYTGGYAGGDSSYVGLGFFYAPDDAAHAADFAAPLCTRFIN